MSNLQKIKRAALIYPGLELALALLSSITLYFRVVYVAIAMIMCLFLINPRKRLLAPLLMLLLFYAYLWLYMGAPIKAQEMQVTGKVRFSNLHLSTGFFGAGYRYVGYLSVEGGPRHLPFTMTRKIKEGRLDPAWIYKVEGKLTKKEGYGFSLKLDGAPTRVQKCLSIAAFRYELKKRYKSLLKNLFPNTQVRDFYMGISSGEFSNSYMSYTFSRFGLNHLLAISGFHFALLLLFLNLVLGPFLPYKFKTIILMLGTLTFYLFVGSGPSLTRAWIVASVYLLSTLLEKRASALNTLALSMVMVLLIDPLLITHLGFQFSYWITFSILLYTSKIDSFFKRYDPFNNKLSRAISKALALSVSVHLAAIPLSLYAFHKFYCLGFIFNLFIPICVSILMLLFLSGLIFYPFIPELSKGIFFLNHCSTEALLNFLFAVPSSFDYCIRIPHFPKDLLFLYLILFFTFGLTSSKKSSEDLSNPLGLRV